MMQLNGVASAVLVVWFVLSSLMLIGLLGVIALVLVKLQAKLEEVASKVEPLLGKTDALVALADEKLRMVGEKAETLLATGEEMAATMQVRVEQTTGTVQRTVNAPLIQANAVATGISSAWAAFTRRAPEPESEKLENAVTAEPRRQKAKVYGD